MALRQELSSEKFNHATMQNTATRLKNQVAIVTGASSGIGAGIARSMAAEGAAVVINYPNDSGKKRAEAVLGEITSAGGKAIIFRADVSNEQEVIAMFSEVIKREGTVDILVNNAGVQKDAAFEEMTLK